MYKYKKNIYIYQIILCIYIYNIINVYTYICVCCKERYTFSLDIWNRMNPDSGGLNRLDNETKTQPSIKRMPWL